MTDITHVAAEVQDLVERYNLRETEHLDWLTGTASGGPNLDGKYPLTSPVGEEKLIASPERLESDWQGKINEADTSATDAAASADAAALSETAASASETASAGSAASADTSEAKAQKWAEELQGIEVELGKYSALHHAANASASETAAGTSETNAAASESAAATSETNAAGSASAASTSETAAAGSASAAGTSETNASASETAAAGSETNAAGSEAKAGKWAEETTDIEVELGKYSSKHHATKADASAGAAATSETNAAGSASAASTSETNAAGSASAASTSETNASGSETKAGKWANEALDIEVETGKYSAFHWSEKAKASATGSLAYKGGWDASTGAFPASPTLGHYYKVTVDGTVDGRDHTVNDSIIYNGGSETLASGWDKVDSTDSVTSVAGKVGAVTLAKGDVGLSAVTNDAQVAKAGDTMGGNLNFGGFEALNAAAYEMTGGGRIRKYAGSYGSASIDGGHATWNGISFPSGYNHPVLMVETGTGNRVGIWRNTGGWDWYFTGGVLSAGSIPWARITDWGDSAHGSRGGGSLHALATTAVDGFMASADKSKLDGVEAGATADQTKADIDALNVNADTVDGQHASEFAASGHGHSNATTAVSGFMAAADKSKLNGIEAGATADQTKADIDALNVDADTVDGKHASELGGSMTLLATATAANSASVEFTSGFSADYDTYVIEILNLVPATNGVGLRMRMSEDGGATWRTDNLYSMGAVVRTDGNSAGSSGGTSTSARFSRDDADVQNGAGKGWSSSTWIYDPLDSTKFPMCFTQFAHMKTTSSLHFGYSGQAFDVQIAANAFQFFMSSGNITSGQFKLYGIKG